MSPSEWPNCYSTGSDDYHIPIQYIKLLVIACALACSCGLLLPFTCFCLLLLALLLVFACSGCLLWLLLAYFVAGLLSRSLSCIAFRCSRLLFRSQAPPFTWSNAVAFPLLGIILDEYEKINMHIYIHICIFTK